MTSDTMGGAATAAPLFAAARVIVPAGYLIEFFQEPKRMYHIDGVEVVSVTQALEVLRKDALTWWGMKVGMAGALEMHRRGVVNFAAWAHMNPAKHEPIGPDSPATLGNIKNLTAEKLTTNHIKSAAGDRGQSAHDALEAWAKTGVLPEPTDYTFEEEGYVRALRAALEALDLEVLDTELIVGSKEHGFAGRYDLRAILKTEAEVVTKVYPKRGPKMTTVPPSKLLIDLKTSKDVFDTHLLQLAAYEGASIESGFGDTDYRAVLQVGADGRYQFVRSRATLEQYVSVLNCYRTMQEVEVMLKR